MDQTVIGFVGLGKLGMDCAEVFAERYTTVGYDVVPRTSDLVTVVSDIGELVERANWIFIAVPTPHDEGYDGSEPSSHLEPRDFGHEAVIESLRAINANATTAKNVVIISTVLPGTTRSKFAPLLDKKHRLLYNPYLIAMGSCKWDMVHPEMVMIGSENADAPEMQQLVNIYRPMMQNDTRFATGTWDECEAIKIFYNTFISAKVTLVNMIQDFAMRIGNINVDVVTEALASSTIRIMSPKYMTAGMGDAGACHPRDNIALRWLAQEYDIGYDMFDTIMHAREVQAANLARFLVETSEANGNLPIVIHGKAYKPDVPYCIGSYSTLVGHYLEQHGRNAIYVDPLADDQDAVVSDFQKPAVILMAHNRVITYGYTGIDQEDAHYFEFQPGSIIVDPWRKLTKVEGCQVVPYGNSRQTA